MPKIPYELTTAHLDKAIETYETHQEKNPEEGMLRAFRILLIHSNILCRCPRCQSTNLQMQGGPIYCYECGKRYFDHLKPER